MDGIKSIYLQKIFCKLIAINCQFQYCCENFLRLFINKNNSNKVRLG